MFRGGISDYSSPFQTIVSGQVLIPLNAVGNVIISGSSALQVTRSSFAGHGAHTRLLQTIPQGFCPLNPSLISSEIGIAASTLCPCCAVCSVPNLSVPWGALEVCAGDAFSRS